MTARGDATRARLVAATQQVVRESGYAHTTTRAIADVAGVAEGTIYRHFPDKLALFMAAAESAGGAEIARLLRLPERAGQGDVVDTLIETLTDLAGLREHVLPLELAIMADPELSARRRELLASTPPEQVPGPHRPLGEYLLREQMGGRIRADVDVAALTLSLLAGLLGLSLIPTPEADAPSPQRIAAMVRLLADGFTP